MITGRRGISPETPKHGEAQTEDRADNDPMQVEHGLLQPIEERKRAGLVAGMGKAYPSTYQAADRTGNQDESAQCYCPWCGGGLSGKAREAANLLRKKMEDSVSRYRAGDLSVIAVAKPVDRRGAAKHSGQAARQEGRLAKRSRLKTPPNPRRDPPKVG